MIIYGKDRHLSSALVDDEAEYLRDQVLKNRISFLSVSHTEIIENEDILQYQKSDMAIPMFLAKWKTLDPGGEDGEFRRYLELAAWNTNFQAQSCRIPGTSIAEPPPDLYLFYRIKRSLEIIKNKIGFSEETSQTVILGRSSLRFYGNLCVWEFSKEKPYSLELSTFHGM